MRPIKLTMTAFGPYAGQEVVDFREAVASGLFGIYGPTGSGKSTIFSAMTFALFGESSRSEQDPVSLRSDHAAPNILTKVEFIFEVGTAHYLIRRTPEQMRPNLRGDGETKDPHKAWLFDVTGIDPDNITEENSGKIIAEKKVSHVKEAVQKRLGYGAEQFRQVVLLPQGDFEKFLTAKTDERMKILRKLFDVSLYRSLAHALKDQAKTAEESVLVDRRTCASRLSQEGYESPDALKAGIDEAETSCEEAQRISVATTKKSIAAAKALTDARHLEASFVAHETAQNELLTLTEKTAAIQTSKTKLENARKAQSLLDVGGALKTAQTTVTDAQIQLSNAQVLNEKAATAKDDAAKILEIQEALSDERDDQRYHAEELGRYTTTLTTAKSLMTDWQDAQSQENKAKAEFDQTDNSYTNFLSQQTREQERAKTAQTQNMERVKLCEALSKAKQTLKTTQTHAEAKQLWSEATGLTKQATVDHADAQDHLSDAQCRYDQAEVSLAAVQAQHLAEKLEDGLPCPVCGSASHPAPATGSAESKGLDNAFRDAKTYLETMRGHNARAAENLSAAKATVNDRKANFDKLPQPEQTPEACEQKVDGLNASLTGLGLELKTAKIEENLARLTEKITASQSHVAKARETFESSKTATALGKQAYDTALSPIPPTLRDESMLTTASQTADTELEAMLAAFKAAQDKATSTRETAISAAKEVEGIEEAFAAAKIRRKTAEDTFSERLRQHGLSPKQLETYTADIGQIETLSAEIDTYNAAQAIAKDRLRTTTETIKDRARPGLETIEQASLTAEDARDADAATAAALKAKSDQLEILLKSIADELSRIEKAERDTADLRELAALFNANNTAKLDLETFAIGAMFDQVLQAANLRLRPMTNGRYSLERALDGKGRGRRGLGISVHDIHTGKARATATLSGGETFIAALALALGLSDIVESVSGNIRLDTIFIDEGFGSLDNDTGTLDQVLQTLRDLVGNNRAVGLISHVPLVQQAIPNGFTIKKTATGSHIETRGF